MTIGLEIEQSSSRTCISLSVCVNLRLTTMATWKIVAIIGAPIHYARRLGIIVSLPALLHRAPTYTTQRKSIRLTSLNIKRRNTTVDKIECISHNSILAANTESKLKFTSCLIAKVTVVALQSIKNQQHKNICNN